MTTVKAQGLFTTALPGNVMQHTLNCTAQCS